MTVGSGVSDACGDSDGAGVSVGAGVSLDANITDLAAVALLVPRGEE